MGWNKGTLKDPYEWQTGQQQITDFTANSFVDVYASHTQTLQHILDGKSDYHSMIAGIFAKAR